MENAENPEASGHVCGICQQPFADGQTVVQVVEDRYPNYDEEVVLHTYHKACWGVKKTASVTCGRCGSWFHLALLRRGRGLPQQSRKLFCPLCGVVTDCEMTV